MPNNKQDRPSSNDFFKSIRDSIPNAQDQAKKWDILSTALAATAIVKNARKK